MGGIWNYLIILLINYEDREVVEWLKFGWPINRDESKKLCSVLINHTGAIEFPQEVEEYLKNEVSLGATIGPFRKPPFEFSCATSPLNS